MGWIFSVFGSLYIRHLYRSLVNVVCSNSCFICYLTEWMNTLLVSAFKSKNRFASLCSWPIHFEHRLQIMVIGVDTEFKEHLFFCITNSDDICLIWFELLAFQCILFLLFKCGLDYSISVQSSSAEEAIQPENIYDIYFIV